MFNRFRTTNNRESSQKSNVYVPHIYRRAININCEKSFPKINTTIDAVASDVETRCVNPTYLDKYSDMCSSKNGSPTISPKVQVQPNFEVRRGYPIEIERSTDVEDDVEEDNRVAFKTLNALNVLYFDRLFNYVETYGQNTHGEYTNCETVHLNFDSRFAENDDDPYYDSEYEE